jgi:glucose-6-phosphate 1-dehydrogenase
MMAPPCAMVIFGAAGDLTKRLVVPSLYDLVRAKRLPERFQLVGVDLAAKTAADWSQSLSEMMNQCVAQGGGEFRRQLDWVAGLAGIAHDLSAGRSERSGDLSAAR